jgi:general secretion pathway protein G
MNSKSRPTRPTRRRRGFTLMEMVVVVTIIAILATLIAPRLIGNITRAKSTKAAAECKAIYNAVNYYLIDVGRPTPEDGMDLSVLLLPPHAGGGSGGPYIEKQADLLDPWGNPYVVRVPGVVNYTFDVVSYGADGQPGGDGENKDITN